MSPWGPLYFNVQLDVTNACNLKCSHCYHSHHRNEGALSADEWLKVIDRIAEFSKKMRMQPKLIFCGGEPLTSPHLRPLTQVWLKKFPHSSKAILTNGTLLTKPFYESASKTFTNYASWIAENNFKVQISLDGPTAETHDKVRGKGNFERTIEGLRRLVDLGVETSILAVLTQSSSVRINEFFQLAKSLGVSQMNFERVITLGQATALDRTDILSGEDLRDAFLSIYGASKSFGVETSTNGPNWAALNPGLGSADTLGFYDWIVDYQGYLKVSSRTPHRLGHSLRDDPAYILLNDPLLKDLRRGKISGCSDCSLFRDKRCSGNRNAAYAATGSYLAADPGCWNLPIKNDYEKEKRRPYLFGWSPRNNTPHRMGVESA